MDERVRLPGEVAEQLEKVRRGGRRVATMRRAEWLVDQEPGKTRDVEAHRRSEWMLD